MTMQTSHIAYICFAVCAVCTSPILAGELRPYNPPVQQQAPLYEQRPQIRQPAQDPYYRDFAEKTARLTPKQKEALVKIFTQRLNEASKAKKWDETRHYAKLLEILNSRSAP